MDYDQEAIGPVREDSERKMSGLDYSKWDKMANEMTDSDEDNGNDPRLTTFAEPQSVTFGGTSASRAAEGWGNDFHEPSPAPKNGSTIEAGAAPAVVAATATKSKSTGAAVATAPLPKSLAPMTNSQLAENGRAVYPEGSGGLGYVWRQTRANVIVVVPTPPGTRAGDVNVLLRAKPETFAEGVADLFTVSVKAKGGGCQEEHSLTVLLEGELAFQTKLDGECGVDWELKDFPGTIVARDTADDDVSTGGIGGGIGVVGEPDEQASGPAAVGKDGEVRRKRADRSSDSSAANRDRRGIEVTLKKHCPVPNATVWWKSLLKGGPEIDVTSIQGRSASNHQSVWEEALGMFKEKVAARKGKGKISVDMGEGD